MYKALGRWGRRRMVLVGCVEEEAEVRAWRIMRAKSLG